MNKLLCLDNFPFSHQHVLTRLDGTKQLRNIPSDTGLPLPPHRATPGTHSSWEDAAGSGDCVPRALHGGPRSWESRALEKGNVQRFCGPERRKRPLESMGNDRYLLLLGNSHGDQAQDQVTQQGRASPEVGGANSTPSRC